LDKLSEFLLENSNREAELSGPDGSGQKMS